MKAMLAALLTLSLVAGLAGQASAATQRKHKQKAYSYRQAAPKSVSSRAAETEPSWYPHDSRASPLRQPAVVAPDGTRKGRQHSGLRIDPGSLPMDSPARAGDGAASTG